MSIFLSWIIGVEGLINLALLHYVMATLHVLIPDLGHTHTYTRTQVLIYTKTHIFTHRHQNTTKFSLNAVLGRCQFSIQKCVFSYTLFCLIENVKILIYFIVRLFARILLIKLWSLHCHSVRMIWIDFFGSNHHIE